MPETMSHLLLHCPHVDLVRLRASVRAELIRIGEAASLIPDCPPAPSFVNDIQLYTVLMLCTGAGFFWNHPPAVAGVLVQPPLPGAEIAVASLADQRRDHALPLDAATVKPVARWVAFLTGRWRDQMSEPLKVFEGAGLGERLVRVVCSHSLRVYSTRRRLLRDDPAFVARSRDPVPVPA